MVSPCLDNEDEIRADQDTAPELKEHINFIFSKGDNVEYDNGDRTSGNGNNPIWRKRKLIQS